MPDREPGFYWVRTLPLYGGEWTIAQYRSGRWVGVGRERGRPADDSRWHEIGPRLLFSDEAGRLRSQSDLERRLADVEDQVEQLRRTKNDKPRRQAAAPRGEP